VKLRRKEEEGLAKSTSDKGKTLCPICGTNVPDDANECPKCGEPFTAEAIKNSISEKERGSKRLFWAGIILVLVGGPGVALGSWLHDLLGIPIGGTAFDTFGWLNSLVSIVGIIILVIGIIFLILSLPKLKDDEPDEDITEEESSEEQGG
jgi:hypothetical protein